MTDVPPRSKQVQELLDILEGLKVKSWTPKPGSLEEILLEMIRREMVVTSGGNRKVSNALTLLRRRGLITNKGTRAHPAWVIVEDEGAQL